MNAQQTKISKTDALNMTWEAFSDFADSIGWSAGSPELMRETIELMFA